MIHSTEKCGASRKRGETLMLSSCWLARPRASRAMVAMQAWSSSTLRPTLAAEATSDIGSAKPVSGAGRIRPSKPMTTPDDRSTIGW